MATYLVLRRMKLDDVHLPGETVSMDPAEKGTGTLLSRGYITPVPDSYPSVSSRSPKAKKPDEAAVVEPVVQEPATDTPRRVVRPARTRKAEA
jgi:hypothetical protein